jgi:hypothetical protein
MAWRKEETTPLHLVQLPKKPAGVVGTLPSHGAGLIKRRPNDNRTPLYFMLKKTHTLCIEVLLLHVTDILGYPRFRGEHSISYSLAQNCHQIQILRDLFAGSSGYSSKE